MVSSSDNLVNASRAYQSKGLPEKFPVLLSKLIGESISLETLYKLVWFKGIGLQVHSYF